MADTGSFADVESVLENFAARMEPITADSAIRGVISVGQAGVAPGAVLHGVIASRHPDAATPFLPLPDLSSLDDDELGDIVRQFSSSFTDVRRVAVVEADLWRYEDLSRLGQALATRGIGFDLARVGASRRFDWMREKIHFLPDDEVRAFEREMEHEAAPPTVSKELATRILHYNDSYGLSPDVAALILGSLADGTATTDTVLPLLARLADMGWSDTPNEDVDEAVKAQLLGRALSPPFREAFREEFEALRFTKESLSLIREFLVSGSFDTPDGLRRMIRQEGWPKHVPAGPGLDAFGLPRDMRSRQAGLSTGWLTAHSADFAGFPPTAVTSAADLVRRDGSALPFLRPLLRVISDVSDPTAFEGTAVPKLISPISRILAKIRDSVVNDEYGIIVGDDTSGRVPALLVAKSVNAYRRQHGMAALPVMFIEGTTEWQEPQRRQFQERFAAKGRVDTDKRGLIVTERVGWGETVASIVNRLAEHGMAADVASLGGASQERLGMLVADGTWKSGTRGFAGGGDAGVVLDKEELSGLRQGMEKFAPHKVIRDDKRLHATVAQTRRDIDAATRKLVRSLE